MEGGTSAHGPQATQSFRTHFGIQSLQWVASCSDLGPSESIWARIKRRIDVHAPRPITKEGDLPAVHEEWDGISPEGILDIIDGMPQHVQAVIAAGANTGQNRLLGRGSFLGQCG